MKTRNPKSKVRNSHVSLSALLLLGIVFASVRLHGAVEVYVTDYLAPQEKSIRPLGGTQTNVARLFVNGG